MLPRNGHGTALRTSLRLTYTCGTGPAPTAVLHVRTSVDIDLLAGDVVSVGDQKDHRFGDFLRDGQTGPAGILALICAWIAAGTAANMSVSV